MAVLTKINTADIPQYVPLAKVAEQFSVHIATVRRVAKKLGVPVVKVGTAHRIRVEHVTLLMTKTAG